MHGPWLGTVPFAQSHLIVKHLVTQKALEPVPGEQRVLISLPEGSGIRVLLFLSMCGGQSIWDD